MRVSQVAGMRECTPCGILLGWGRMDVLREAGAGGMSPRANDAGAVLSAVDVANRAVLVVGSPALGAGNAERLEAEGFTVIPVGSVAEARTLLEDRIPAAVLLRPSAEDDPYQLVRWIRLQERLAFVQVFIIASPGDELRMADGIAAGADDILEATRLGSELVDCIVARIARSRSIAGLALLDPLTGLYNRRFMDDRLRAEVARAGRAQTKLSLALIDLDDFKRINDTLGHTAGDRALAAFAHVLRASLREYDMTCRFGGDEFIALFPDCDAIGAEAALSQVRVKVALADSASPRITFCAGIAECPGDGISWTDLFEVADRNVRQAKAGGRNRAIRTLT
jgi:diguanylate cyclase (GGDEF)-like protein